MKNSLLLLGLALFSLSPVFADTRPPDLTKIETALKEQIQKLEGTKNPADMQKKMVLGNTLNAITHIKIRIKAGKLQDLDRHFGIANHSYIPTELREDITRAQIALKDYALEIIKEKESTRRKRIDVLIEKTKKLTISDTNVGDLEATLVEITSLGRPQNHTSDPLSQRYQRKNDGLIFTLQSLIRYYDFKQVGNATQANYQLKGLLSSNKHPILTIKQIKSAYLPVPPEGNAKTDPIVFFSMLNSLADLPKAIEAMDKLKASSHYSSNRSLQTAYADLTDLHSAWKNITEGDGSLALGSASKRSQASHSDSIRRLDLLKIELEHLYLKKFNLVPQNMTIGEHEGGYSFLIRKFSRQLKEKNYQEAAATAIKADKFYKRIPIPTQYLSDLLALQLFLAGQRFEQANDPLFALSRYRQCVDHPGVTNAPVNEAKEGIKRITAKHPDLSKDLSGEILNRIDKLERNLMLRQGSSRYRR